MVRRGRRVGRELRPDWRLGRLLLLSVRVRVVLTLVLVRIV